MRDAKAFDELFRRAVAAIDAGDAAALSTLLADHPELVRERHTSPGKWLRDQIGPALKGFYKDPYLMWFVTEDAVRTGQLSANVAAVARVMIDAARRDSVRSLPEQLASTFHFAVCSPIGRDDGRQLELLDALIDAGASMDGGADQAFICYNDAAARHLIKRGARLTLPAAVCFENADDINRLASVATKNEKQMALALGSLNGKANGLRALLKHGVVLDDFSTGFYTHATPLHHAVWSGSLDAVKVLVEAGARLNIRDKAEDATPLGWAEYAASGDDSTWRERGKQYDLIADYLRARA